MDTDIDSLRAERDAALERLGQLQAAMAVANHRITELEAQLATLEGSLAPPTRDGGIPFEVVESPPTTPR